MTTFPKEPMGVSTKVEPSHAYLAASGLFHQAIELERFNEYGTGRGGHDLIDDRRGYTKCCDKEYSNDLSLLRHLRSVEHGVGLAAKEVYGDSPYAPKGEWRYFKPNYIRFANSYAVKLAKQIAKFAGKISPPVIPNGKLSDQTFRQKLALDLAQAYIDHLPSPKSPNVT